ncbi:beta-lactamase/transpeptidase-like protein [Leptodontidium sp. 2 PMI_412]|nr:beta-lactamase/transpeptidase-like protein [Leptodontidium sp. 2 PMI_412]
MAFAISQHLVHAFNTESFLGPAFSIPQNLSDNPTIKTANQDFLTIINEALETGSSTHGLFDNISTAFSFEFYSASVEEPLFQYHYSPPILADAEKGVKTVDRNTIYRIGSITKLLTVYTSLITDGDAHFNEPVTKYIPELLVGGDEDEKSDDPVRRVAWDEVTIGSLASHMAGVGSTYGWLDISLADFPVSELNLPSLPADEKPNCGASLTRPPCPEDGFASRSPVFPTFQTPVYSNAAFQIFSLALSRITGKDFKTLMDEALFKPLNLSRTSYTKPDDSLGVIPGNATTTFWNFEMGGVWPTGGVWSSTADLSTLGRSILTSKILTPSQTRRWMKPLTHTASLHASIGAPWEIQRIVLPASNRVVDLYTKSGKVGIYGGYMILVPDFDVGFTLLQAGPGLNTDVLAGWVVDIFLPALEEAARLQAVTDYTGEYKVQTQTQTPGTNSSFTLSSEKGKPGLILTNWINNNYSLPTLIPILKPLAIGDIETATALLELYKSGVPLIDPSTITINLYPTGLRTPVVDGGELVSFRAGFDIISDGEDTSPFADSLVPWSIADVFVYGNQGLDEFVFRLDGEGSVVSVENKFLRAVFRKL